MPEFVYVARNLEGHRVTGEISAASEREVVSLLSNRKLFPLEVTEQKEETGIRIRRRPPAQAMANMYSQLASLLSNGVPLLRSLTILREQTNSPVLREVLADVAKRIEDGSSIGDAFARHPKVFNEVAVNMSRAGAEGGFLEDALERIARFTSEQSELRGRTLGALVYPFVLFGMGTVIVSVLIIYFVPMFGDLFDQLRAQGKLPWPTDALLGFSEIVRSWGLLILGLFAALFITLRVQSGTEKGRYFIDGAKLRLPLFGPIFKDLAIARFCRVLGTLLTNGVPILKGLEISRHATGNSVLSSTIEKATENISGGQSLAAPLLRSGQFPATVTEMIAIAEESNTLDKVLVNIAEDLEKGTSRRLDLLVRLLEPIMLMIMAVIIMFIVIALLMPILNMGSAFA
jgi:type II secretory pathway component PulF